MGTTAFVSTHSSCVGQDLRTVSENALHFRSASAPLLYAEPCDKISLHMREIESTVLKLGGCQSRVVGINAIHNEDDEGNEDLYERVPDCITTQNLIRRV